MQLRYFVHIGKAVFALISFLLLAFVAVGFALNHFWIPFAVCACLSILFLLALLSYGAQVHISEQGIRCRQLPFRKKEFQWQDLQEVGIVGTHVFGTERAKRRGSKFIYFSPCAYTEDERFQMCLKWPPKDIIYMQYKPSRVKSVEKYWNNGIVLYNADNLFWDDDDEDF